MFFHSPFIFIISLPLIVLRVGVAELWKYTQGINMKKKFLPASDSFPDFIPPLKDFLFKTYVQITLQLPLFCFYRLP